MASQALTTLVGISIFLAYGTTAAVARQLGAGNRHAAIRQGIDGLWLATLIGVAVLAICWPLATQIVHAFGGSPGRYPASAVIYLQDQPARCPPRCSWCWPEPGCLRGLQDTRTPLAVAVAANLVNAVLNAILVLVLHWGIARLGLGHRHRADQCGRRLPGHGAARRAASRRVHFGPDAAGLRAAAVTGFSLVVRTLALQAVFIVITAIAAHQGNAAVAAHQIAIRLWTLIAFALDAIAIAGQAITGRYLGAGDVAGARAATNRMIGWGVLYGVLFGVLLLVAIPVLPSLFAAALDVRRLLVAVLLVAAAQQPVAGVVFVLDGVLIGAGDQDYLALAGLAAGAVFAAGAAIVVAQHGGLVALWLAFSGWLLARFCTLTLRARGSQWLVTGAVRR